MDQNNRPVPGAVIKVSRPDQPPIEAVSDSDGLYSTTLVPEGYYYLDVFSEGKYRGVKELVLDSVSGSKKFFLINVHSRKFAISAVDKDPGMSYKLGKKEHSDIQRSAAIDNKGTYMFMLKVDTTRSKADTTPAPKPLPHKKSTYY